MEERAVRVSGHLAAQCNQTCTTLLLYTLRDTQLCLRIVTRAQVARDGQRSPLPKYQHHRARKEP